MRALGGPSPLNPPPPPPSLSATPARMLKGITEKFELSYEEWLASYIHLNYTDITISQFLHKFVEPPGIEASVLYYAAHVTEVCVDLSTQRTRVPALMLSRPRSRVYVLRHSEVKEISRQLSERST